MIHEINIERIPKTSPEIIMSVIPKGIQEEFFGGKRNRMYHYLEESRKKKTRNLWSSLVRNLCKKCWYNIHEQNSIFERIHHRWKRLKLNRETKK